MFLLEGQFMVRHPDYIKSEAVKQKVIKGEISINRDRCTQYKAVVKFCSDSYISASQRLLRLCSDSELTNFSDSEVESTNDSLKRKHCTLKHPEYVYDNVGENLSQESTGIKKARGISRPQVPTLQSFSSRPGSSDSNTLSTTSSSGLSEHQVEQIISVIKTSIEDVCRCIDGVNSRLDNMDGRISLIEDALKAKKPDKIKEAMAEKPTFLPMDTWENMEEVEVLLKENCEIRSAMMHYLTGVSNQEVEYTSAVRAVLRQCMGMDVQRNVSWMGSNKRKSMQNLPTLVRLLQMCFLQHHTVPEETNGRAAAQKQAATITMKWFYGAGDRGGGRESRKGRKLEQQAETINDQEYED
ncbi:uncharacterized protein LOC124153341 [Ischnura elegans]|uniref:uncharacterized protein LOC124153341 n=1 Tax=Ischnura elegans TaxID=197161 RepID=UPI001ED8985E|nr:uncharacterized protein LOC124153341 [Ischnura elegans]